MSALLANAKALGARAGFTLVLSLVVALIVTVEIPGLTQWQWAEGDRVPRAVRAPRDVFTRQPVSISDRQGRLEVIQQRLGQIEQARRAEIAWTDVQGPGFSEALIPLVQALSPTDWDRLRTVITDTLTLTDELIIAEGNLEQAQLYALILLQERLDEPALVQVAQMLVLPWIRPNTLTNAYAVGEEIAGPDLPLTRTQMAALSQLDLIFHTWLSRHFFFVWPLSLLLVSLLQWVVPQFRPHIGAHKREWATLLGLSVILLLAVRLLMPQAAWMQYMLPVAAFSMLLRTLVGYRVALALMLSLALMVGFMSQLNLHFLLFMILGTLIGVVALPQGNRIRHFVTAGAWVAGMNLLWLIPMELNGLTGYTPWHWDQEILLAFVGLANGFVSSSIALAGTYALGELTGRITSFKLLELARPDHPLLVLLHRMAPGTYQHTMRVSEMAERAAQAIGADPLLARVGAYYHDIGKIPQAYLFAENMAAETNPHAEYTPVQSARIIIDHVAKGVMLGRKYGLPSWILDFIQEHHGRQLVTPFYAAALKACPEGQTPDPTAFRYPGPLPRSRETALLMLADSCEAACRAARTDDPATMRQIVEKQFDLRVQDGSLAHSPLSLGDLRCIMDVLTEMLVSTMHQRIPYPDLNALTQAQLTPVNTASNLPAPSRLPSSL